MSEKPKVTSFSTSGCQWCNEIRRKYTIRKEIAEKVGLNGKYIEELEEFSIHATCPFHKMTAYLPDSLAVGKGRIEIKTENNTVLVIAYWWTNNYHYKLSFDIAHKKVSFETDHPASSVTPSHRIDFDSLFHELLVYMSEKQLEELKKALEQLEKQEDC